MVIHRTHPYPAYGGPGAVTGDVAGRQDAIGNLGPLRGDPIRKGVKRKKMVPTPLVLESVHGSRHPRMCDVVRRADIARYICSLA